MLHTMKLNNEPFEMIENGRKTIELRLNDEKRSKIQIGDFIELSHMDKPDRKIQVRVTSLYHSDNFNELFSEIPKEKYGALGIEFRKTALQKFIDAQEICYSFGETYQTALKEIKKGMKISCWMWYVFPQIKGLGWSGTTAYFSINDLNEAIDYYDHPVLGERLIEITSVLLELDNNDPVAVFGIPDAYKLRSCMTLFKHAAPDNELFQRVLDKFCQGAEDEKTLELL